MHGCAHPFQTIVLARLTTAAKASAVFGPTSMPYTLPHASTIQQNRLCKKMIYNVKVNVKEADLYSAFIEVPYTQGAQVRITQSYLQTTLYLPLPRKHSPDGASQTEVTAI